MKINKIIISICALSLLCSCGNTAESDSVVSYETTTNSISETTEKDTASNTISSSKSETTTEIIPSEISSDTTEEENKTDTILTKKAEVSVTEIEETESETTVTVQTNPPETTVNIPKETITSKESETSKQTTIAESGSLPVLKNTPDIDYLDFFSESLFIGDSICSGLKVYAGLLDTPHVAARVNVSTWGINKYKFQYLNNSSSEKSALDIVKYYKPKDIYIWMGMNDLYVVSEEKFCDNMCSLAKSYIKASPDSKVHVVSISPMTKGHKWNVELDGNNRVNEYNKAMEERCEDTDYLDFINIHDLLINSGGFLASDNNGGDGIHLSASAYKIVLNGIYDYMTSLPEPEDEITETEAEITEETTVSEEETSETTTVPCETSEEESEKQSRIRELLDKFKV